MEFNLPHDVVKLPSGGVFYKPKKESLIWAKKASVRSVKIKWKEEEESKGKANKKRKESKKKKKKRRERKKKKKDNKDENGIQEKKA
jgi:hypothetical protein